MFTLYYYDDLSLGEIAENLNITRQAVYDNIKRAEKLLKNYEDKLHLVEKFLKQQEKIRQTKTLFMEYKSIIAKNENGQLQELLQKIESILEDLLVE